MKQTEEHTREKRRTLLWQAAAGIFFVIMQLVAVWYKKGDQDLVSWLAEKWAKDPWGVIGLWSLGLLGAAILVYAVLDYYLEFGDAALHLDAKNLHNTRMLVFAALMIAMARALSLVPGIPIFHTKLTFGFLARALCALVCGPVLGLVYGFVEDILGFILQPSGEFFFGYTLSTMLGVLIYALCFYRRRVTVAGILLANFLVNLLVNAVLGSVWNVMIRGGTFWGWYVPSLIKNMATIVPKTLLLYILFNSMLPILRRMGVLPHRSDDKGIRLI